MFFSTLIKKKRKFFSCVRKIRVGPLQSHIWGRASNIWGIAQIFPHIWGGRLQLLQPLNVLIYEENLIFFLQCMPHVSRAICSPDIFNDPGIESPNGHEVPALLKGRICLHHLQWKCAISQSLYTFNQWREFWTNPIVPLTSACSTCQREKV